MSFQFEKRVEVGPWFEVGHRINGSEAKDFFTSHEEQGLDKKRPYCIYLHVPFCTSRCSYCALYTHAITENKNNVFDNYVDHVKKAISNNPRAHTLSPPTTVHFGGGTPLSIGVDRFEKLVNEIRNTFGDSPKCEWALETTTSSINPDSISALKSLGIKRIHLGIQTLNDKIRQNIHRRESGKNAIKKIELLNIADFNTSVDLIIGFENQTEQIIANDLATLHSAGIQIFSICELRNLNIKTNAALNKEMHKKNYHSWQLIWDFMRNQNLIPIHLGQFGHSYADNYYFTHPIRGEDCVAIGPYAHGTEENMYYSNNLLPEYYKAIDEDKSPIEFAVIYSDIIQKIRSLESELLAHQVMVKTIQELLSLYPEEFPRILDYWFEQNLLVGKAEKTPYCLSQQGSWFVGNMIMQIREMYTKNIGIQ